MTRLNSLQIWAADLAATARFYGQFIGLELDEEPHQHDGNDDLLTTWRGETSRRGST